MRTPICSLFPFIVPSGLKSNEANISSAGSLAAYKQMPRACTRIVARMSRAQSSCRPLRASLRSKLIYRRPDYITRVTRISLRAPRLKQLNFRDKSPTTSPSSPFGWSPRSTPLAEMETSEYPRII